MTTRVEEKTRLHREMASCQPRMLEKTMLCQAALKATDKVLDANVCSGQVAEYLLRNTDCQVCGVSDQREEIRQIRAKLFGGDFVYAAIDDIPWPDGTFHTALMHPVEGNEETFRAQLRECKRVLKLGGQLVLALKRQPAILQKVSQFLWDSTEESLPDADTAQQIMETMGFEKISRVQAGLGGYVLVGWLSKEA